MNNNFMRKIKNFLAFLLIASILTFGSYLIVYKVSFLPNGYDIEKVQKDNVSLKSFNILGIGKDVKTLSFSGDETWYIDEIDFEVKRQKTSLWLLFSAITISTFLLIYKLRNGLKLWKAIFESNFFATLIPLITVITSLHRIHMILDLIS
ncbi:hypothetical protein ACQKCU_03420 [Heyndrickxia sporothermodurans]